MPCIRKVVSVFTQLYLSRRYWAPFFFCWETPQFINSCIQRSPQFSAVLFLLPVIKVWLKIISAEPFRRKVLLSQYLVKHKTLHAFLSWAVPTSTDFQPVRCQVHSICFHLLSLWSVQMWMNVLKAHTTVTHTQCVLTWMAVLAADVILDLVEMERHAQVSRWCVVGFKFRSFC